MSTCQRCGAAIAITEAACRYCGAASPEGIAFRRSEQQQREMQIVAQAKQQYYARAQAEATVVRISRNALYWSLVGLLLCCLPIPAIVAIVLARSAQKAARQHGLPLPGQGAAAFVLGIVGCTAGIALYAFAIADSRALSARREMLRAQVERAAASEITLSQNTACGLVELWLFENPFEGRSWSSSDHFDCPGRVGSDKEAHAILSDIRIRYSNEPSFVATACLKRGARWMVEDLRRGPSCSPTEVPSAGQVPTAAHVAGSSVAPVVSRPK